MPPGTVAGFIFLIAALSPGFVFHRMIARFHSRDSRSPVVELVEMATAGALATAVAVVATLGVGELVPGLLSAAEVFGDANALRARPWDVLRALALVLPLSLGLATLAGWLWTRRSREQPAQIRQGSVWSGVLSAKKNGKPAYLAVELDDGRVVEGVFRAVSDVDDPDRDAVVLRRPISLSGPGNVPLTRVNEEFVLIPRTAIRLVHGTHDLRVKQAEEE
ncbi:DUF6338 family protein [Streptomyces sp. ID05-26A]|nr:DUF6338 family protein [Streptomyces sp. ID05-26A]